MKRSIVIKLVVIAVSLTTLGLAVIYPQFLTLIWNRIVEFGAPTAATAIAIVLLGVVFALARRWSEGPDFPHLDPVTEFADVVDPTFSHDVTSVQRNRIIYTDPADFSSLNIQCRLRDETPFTKPFVPVIAHNGTGGQYHLNHGVFFGCDRKHIDVGSPITVWIGRMPFELTVKWDDMKEVAYVLIPHSREELIAVFNRERGDGAGGRTNEPQLFI